MKSKKIFRIGNILKEAKRLEEEEKNKMSYEKILQNKEFIISVVESFVKFDKIMNSKIEDSDMDSSLSDIPDITKDDFYLYIKPVHNVQDKYKTI